MVQTLVFSFLSLVLFAVARPAMATVRCNIVYDDVKVGSSKSPLTKEEWKTLQIAVEEYKNLLPTHAVLAERFFKSGDWQKSSYIAGRILGLSTFSLDNQQAIEMLKSLNTKELQNDPRWSKKDWWLNSTTNSTEVLIENILTQYFNSKVYGVNNFANLMKLMKNLTPLFDDKTVDFIANQFEMKVNAIRHPDYFRIPSYNRFKMIKESVREGLGVPSEVVQDIFLAKDAQNEMNPAIHILAFSNHSVNDSSVNRFGFSVVELDLLPAKTKQINKTYSWSVDGNVASAHVGYKILDQSIFEINRVSPNYNEMLRDQQLTGMILISDGLGQLAPELAEYYTDYLTSHHFKIEELPLMSAPEAFTYILERVKSGEIDYALREGHSEFSSENLISYKNVPLHILRMERKKSGNKVKEVVYVIFPEYKGSSTSDDRPQTLSISELGEALRERNKNDQQFLYVDSACVSHCSVAKRYELAAARGFLTVGTDSLMNTFTDESGGGTFEFFDGIRNQRSYQEIADKTKEGESFIFPNNEYYLNAQEFSALEPISLMISRNFSPKGKTQGGGGK